MKSYKILFLVFVLFSMSALAIIRYESATLRVAGRLKIIDSKIYFVVNEGTRARSKLELYGKDVESLRRLNKFNVCLQIRVDAKRSPYPERVEFQNLFYVLKAYQKPMIYHSFSDLVRYPCDKYVPVAF